MAQQQSEQVHLAGQLGERERRQLGLPWLWWAARSALTQQKLLTGHAASLHDVILSCLQQVTQSGLILCMLLHEADQNAQEPAEDRPQDVRCEIAMNNAVLPKKICLLER